jgi:hypothetical protein
MHDHFRHVGLVHPAQHLCEIGDRSPPQQSLHRQQHDVEFGPASIGLLTQRVTKEIFIPWTEARIRGIRFCHPFRRLHRHTRSTFLNIERHHDLD